MTADRPPGTDPGSRPSTPTAPEPVSLAQLRRARRWRRLIIVVVALFVAAGVLGLLGPRTATSTATVGGWGLEVRHPSLNRAGLAVPFEVTVTRPDGFDGPVTLRVGDEFLAALDENGLDPQPREETSGERAGDAYVEWTFDPPEEGSELIVSLDARIEPGQRGRVDGFVEVAGEDGDLPRVDFTTWLLP